MRLDADCSCCFLETSTHLEETKLKIVVLLSRVERDKTLGEIVISQPTISIKIYESTGFAPEKI
jgi:hypothetical protein